MTKSYSTVNANTDSFEAWVNKTNDLLIDMGNVVVTSNADGSSGITNGSVTINDTLSANTGAFTTLRGGNTSTSNTLTVTSDVMFTDEVNFKGGGNYLKIWDNNSTNYYVINPGNITTNYELNMAAGNVTLQPGTLVPTTGDGATGNWDINANTASAWATARTITLGGDATGFVTINGSSNATLSVTVVDNSHNHTIANVTGLQTVIDSKVNVSGDQTISGVKSFTSTTQFGTSAGTFIADGNRAIAVLGSTTEPAVMTFHRLGAYGFQFGQDTDGHLKMGGWSAGTVRHTWQNNGNYIATGEITAFSDIRLKDNITAIDNSLNKILSIRGVTFTRTDQDDIGRIHMGVIAQEVEQYFPELILEDNTGIKSVNYGAMAGAFIEAFKDQQKQIDDLRTMVDKLINS